MVVETYKPTTALPGTPVRLTAAAIRHFEHQLTDSASQVIRLSVKTSGCTGYAYVLDKLVTPQASDIEIRISEQLTLCIAPEALPLLRDTEIDYIKEGLNGVLKFNNPNVVAECGCGESFNVS